MASPAPIPARIAQLNWSDIKRALDQRGFACLPGILTPAECRELIDLYRTGKFRTRVDMAKHRFGEGEYKYFDRPLPRLVADLCQALYPRLAPVANRWADALGQEEHFPTRLADFLSHCHAQGQCRPTPLLLHYEAGGFNCLHQDLYGDVAFPLQVVFLLSCPAQDFSGGQLLLVEQRPRAQSRGEAIDLGQGEALIFTTRHRPVNGAKGAYAVTVRHGVSRIHSGRRFSLGIIFHDAN